MPSFFTTKFALWVIGGLVVAITLLYAAEEIRIHNWKVDYATQGVLLQNARDDLHTARDNIIRLDDALAKQNAAIAAMKAKAIADKAAADARVKAALAARDNVPEITGAGPDVMNAWQRALYGVIP